MRQIRIDNRVHKDDNNYRTTDEGSNKLTKTQTVTFRLSTTLLEELRRDADLEGLSLNNFVTRIFSNHIQWERYERKVGLLPMTEPFLREVLSQLTEEQVVNLAQKIEKQKFKDIFAFMKESPDIEDFVEVLRSWLTVSWMQHNIEIRNRIYHFKIQHNLGKKWSLYVKTLVSELSQDVLGKRGETKTISDTMVSLAFSMQD